MSDQLRDLIVPDDRVLVALMPTPRDFKLVQAQGWYRIPQRHAPKGLYAEWIAFYFGRNFSTKKYAIHTIARNNGHELTTRADLLPDQPTHPRAHDIYYKIQLDELFELERPIISLRWRRILFVHTTGDRFLDAVEVNDLLIDGDGYVNRAFTSLREEIDRPYIIEEDGRAY